MIDTNEKIRIDLPSKSRQINIFKELLLSLDEMELDYVLNQSLVDSGLIDFIRTIRLI